MQGLKQYNKIRLPLIISLATRQYCVKTFTKVDVAKHSKSTDCWMIIEDKVYDITKFINDHPGGDVILDVSHTSFVYIKC